MSELKAHYDNLYRQENAFRHRETVYRPFIRGLIAKTKLKPGSTVLDAGCGQGFFSSLFHESGMAVYGVDISTTAIGLNNKKYSYPGIKFLAGDILAMPFKIKFDCVFVKSCSLYNCNEFAVKREVTDSLLTYVKPGGLFIFAYNSNLFPLTEDVVWRHHTLEQLNAHFSRYANAETFFINKILALLAGKYAYNSLSTRLGIYLSRTIRGGGELVCIIRN